MRVARRDACGRREWTMSPPASRKRYYGEFVTSAEKCADRGIPLPGRRIAIAATRFLGRRLLLLARILAAAAVFLCGPPPGSATPMLSHCPALPTDLAAQAIGRMPTPTGIRQ